MGIYRARRLMRPHGLRSAWKRQVCAHDGQLTCAVDLAQRVGLPVQPDEAHHGAKNRVFMKIPSAILAGMPLNFPFVIR